MDPKTHKIICILCLSVFISTCVVSAASAANRGPGTRYYERNLRRLSQVLGAIHHLREVCNANEGQLWRQKMVELLETEAPSPRRRALLVQHFNQGYRGQQLTYRTCTKKAGAKALRFVKEGASLADKIAKARKKIAK